MNKKRLPELAAMQRAPEAFFRFTCITLCLQIRKKHYLCRTKQKDMEATKELLKMLLPDDLRDSFEIVDVKKVSNTITITLEEHDRIMHPEAGHEYEKNGFYEAKRVEDYPIRSSKVVLMVKRRRWIDRTTGRSVGNEYDTVAHGTRMSKELALFFQGLPG